MSAESAAEYRRRMSAEARAAVDIKWIRNVLATLLAGVLLTAIRKGKLEVPTVLEFVENAIATAIFIAVWEGTRYLHQRFWTKPYAAYREREDSIARLELELADSRRQRHTQQQRRALAAALSHQVEDATHTLWVKRPDNADSGGIAQWVTAIDLWHEKTLQIMVDGGCSEPEIRAVRELGNLAQFNLGNHRYSRNGDIQRSLIRLDGYRQRLEPIISKYDNS